MPEAAGEYGMVRAPEPKKPAAKASASVPQLADAVFL